MSMNNKNNKSVVESLYKALAKGDTDAAVRLLATDLEWWFHGPPHCQHMMRVLTGESEPRVEFPFKPRTVTAIDGTQWVVAEGWKGEHSYWVHVWTVKDGAVMTQFREYFNTLVTVRDLRSNIDGDDNNNKSQVCCDTKSSSPSVARKSGRSNGYMTLWQSQLPLRYCNGNPDSMPGLVLAV